MNATKLKFDLLSGGFYKPRQSSLHLQLCTAANAKRSDYFFKPVIFRSCERRQVRSEKLCARPGPFDRKLKSETSNQETRPMKNRICRVAWTMIVMALTGLQSLAQSTYTPYAFTNFAGLPKGPGNADGTGTAARFNYPAGLAVDRVGNLYVADAANTTIRKVSPGGVVTTLAGLAQFDENGNPVGGSDDGTGSAARFDAPFGVAVDSVGNIYVADNNRIAKGTPSYLRFDTSPGNLTVSEALFRMRLIGASDRDVIVESSTNLQVWTPFQTNALSSGGLDLSILLGGDQKQFFRARRAP
jgi:hypothetical protein